ncbi:MAG: hypothetical protein PVG65_07305 [Candidatus Thorarchaeota archaeon]|jgi:hypothetical protein
MICVPGIPIKRRNPCVDPLQKPISHIIPTYKIVDKQVVFKGYYPNTEDYPEYKYAIQLFIDTKMSGGE